MRKKVSGRLLLTAVGLLGIAGLLITGCGGLPENAAASVNGTIITKDDVATRIENLRKIYGAMVPEENEGEWFTDFQKEVTNQLVMEELQNQQVKERGLTVSDAEIDDWLLIKADDEFLGDYERMKEDYAAKGVNEEEMREDVRRQLLFNKLKEDIGKDIEVTDDDAQAYYERNRSQYDRPARYQVRQLVTDNEADARAAVGRARAGESFVELVKEYSQEPGAAEKRGALGLVGQGQLAPELEKAAFALKIGEISEPVKVGEQWYVVTVENIVESLYIPYEEVREEIKALYRNQLFSERWREFVAEVYDDSSIEYAPDYDPANKVKTTPVPAGD